MTKLYLAIPCYNEEEVLRDSASKLLNKYDAMMSEGKITSDSRIVFIDDGSKDKTWSIIKQLHEENSIFQGIKLSRNRGHQNALLAGLMTLKDKADAVISIDADLQDDINAFDEMLEKYENGCDVVYGVRSKRETDTFFKRFTAEAFYKILNKMGAKVIFNHADFRLMSKRALEAFSSCFFSRFKITSPIYLKPVRTFLSSQPYLSQSLFISFVVTIVFTTTGFSGSRLFAFLQERM